MKIVAVVPMKLNNRRLPGKNIKSFTMGKPLCHYILSTLLKINIIDDVYVYCSDRSIEDYIPNQVKFLQRSSKLDSDSTKMNEILYSFAKEVDADIYVLTHATAPFIKKDSIEKAILQVKSGLYDSAFSVKKIQDFMWIDGKPFNYNLEEIPRTQDLPPIFTETCGFYVYRKDLILTLKRRIGEKPSLIECDEIESIDIDEPIDFEIADAVFNHLFNHRASASNL